MDASLEYILEHKTILTIDENDKVSSEDVPNDYIFLKNEFYLDGVFYNLPDFPFKYDKVGAKVALMKSGIVFKEIIVENTFGLYTAIIYNDYLNIYYCATNYDHDSALLFAYTKALYDIMQFDIRGYHFGNEEDTEYNQPLLRVSEKETFDINDYILNKFCQDLETGDLTDTLNVVSISEEDVANLLDYKNVDNIKLKFYEVPMSGKIEKYHIIYGQLFNRNGDFITGKCYFDKDLSEALCKTYVYLIDSAINMHIKKSRFSWTNYIGDDALFHLCNDYFLDTKRNENLTLNVYNSREYINDTKSLSDYYGQIKVQRKKLYLNDIFFIKTGHNTINNDSIMTINLENLIKQDDMYLTSLIKWIIKKVKIIK